MSRELRGRTHTHYKIIKDEIPGRISSFFVSVLSNYFYYCLWEL